MSRRILFYVYFGERLVDIRECYSEEGAKDWVSALHGIPRHELVATRVARNAKEGC